MHFRIRSFTEPGRRMLDFPSWVQGCHQSRDSRDIRQRLVEKMEQELEDIEAAIAEMNYLL